MDAQNEWGAFQRSQNIGSPGGLPDPIGGWGDAIRDLHVRVESLEMIVQYMNTLFEHVFDTKLLEEVEFKTQRKYGR